MGDARRSDSGGALPPPPSPPPSSLPPWGGLRAREPPAPPPPPCLGPVAGHGMREPIHRRGRLYKAQPFLGRVAGWSQGSPLVEVAGVAGRPHAGMEAAPLVGSCSAPGSSAAGLTGIVNLRSVLVGGRHPLTPHHGRWSLFAGLGSYLPHAILTPSPYPSLPFPHPFTPPHPRRAPVALHGWPMDEPLAAGASTLPQWRSLTCSPSLSSWIARYHPIDLPLIQSLAVGCVELVLEALVKDLPGIRWC
uniref:Uncharacterized protein n=1 Tax=Setaria viridis TaxID=4556 RepID=A0A4V6D3X3_SETVI|nr:hypothetical protein SEVIR_7G077400v2 [Setaria viridis]